MPPRYINGHFYDFHAVFGVKRLIPYVLVQVYSCNNGHFEPILGVMDTGATTSILTFETARRLGIKRPEQGYRQEGYTVTGRKVIYYVHRVIAQVIDSNKKVHEFILYPGFAKKVLFDHFGMDLTWHFCLAFDWQSVNLLRD